LFNQNFLNIEQIPIFANRKQQVIEELVEAIPQAVPNLDYVLSQLNLVTFNALADLASHWLLPLLDVVDA
jgi:hypothetical protein